MAALFFNQELPFTTMSDDIDIANENAQLILEAQIQEARRVETKLPVGECLWCGEDDPEYIKPDSSFCSCDCRDRWELKTKQARRGF